VHYAPGTQYLTKWEEGVEKFGKHNRSHLNNVV